MSKPSLQPDKAHSAQAIPLESSPRRSWLGTELHRLSKPPQHLLGYDRNTHIIYLALLLAVLTLPAFMSVASDPNGRVSLGSWTLPNSCLSRTIFGIRCPGCGLTRSVIYLTHGDLAASWGMHRLGFLLYSYCVYQVGVRLYCLLFLRKQRPRPLLFIQYTFPIALVLLLIVNWMV